jgi:uncharacterized protein
VGDVTDAIGGDALAAARPAPRRQTERDRPFWEGCGRGELSVLGCVECGARFFPSQERCPACGSRRVAWAPVGSTGTLYSFVVIHGPGSEGRPPAFDAAYPYAVGLVEVDGGEGARIAGNVVDVPPEGIEIGMRLRARFLAGEKVLPEWVPA